MQRELLKISLMENAEPFCVKAPRSIPFAYHEKLRQELDSLLHQDIIAPVTDPTAWCAPIVITPKERNRGYQTVCGSVKTDRVCVQGTVPVTHAS